MFFDDDTSRDIDKNEMAQITSSVIDLKPTVEQVMTKCLSEDEK